MKQVLAILIFVGLAACMVEAIGYTSKPCTKTPADGITETGDPKVPTCYAFCLRNYGSSGECNFSQSKKKYCCYCYN